MARIAGALALTICAACTITADVLPESTAYISVNLGQPGRTVPEGIFGSNIQWEHSGDGILVRQADGEYGWTPGILDAIRQARITNLRFPGGLLANTYDWTAGIGPVSQRPEGLSFANTPVPSIFGTDEYLRLCHEAGLEGCITVNVSEGPRRAAEWVEYVNGDPSTPRGGRRAVNGIEQPLGVKYWEIGNEIYAPDTRGHLSAREYGEEVKRFARSMKARDPGIKVGACLEGAFLQAAWMKGIYPHLSTWNEEVLEVCGQDIDFVSVHFYVLFDSVRNELAMHQMVWAGPELFRENLEQVRALLRQYARPDVEIAVTEYSTFFDEKVRPGPRIASTENALFVASMLLRFMREPGIFLANHWSLLNNSTFGLVETDEAGGLRRRPTFHIFEMLGGYAGARLLSVSLDCATYSVEAKGNLPAMSGVPVVDAAAVEQPDGTLHIALVNRNPLNPVRVELALEGAAAPRTLEATTLAPPGGSMAQTWNPPVVEVLSQDAEGRFSHVLPPHSFTELTGIE